MKVIIAGGRDFNDYQRLKIKMDHWNWVKGITCVVTGGAKGADTLGNQWALDSNINGEIYLADWDRYGKGAGPKRNTAMAKSGAEVLFAFWDGKSRGTLNMINQAVENNLEVITSYY